MAKKNKFSKSVQYNGIIFDSILEAKFAMLIEDTCEYYYHPFTIWYDKKDPFKLGKQTCSNQYQPDFLVRKIKGNTCQLIEIKSSIDEFHIDTHTKADRAAMYIKSKGYDWEYKVITEKDFVFPKEKLDKLDRVKKTRGTVGRKNQSSRQHFKYSEHNTNYQAVKIPMDRHHSDLSDSDYLHFIKTGIIRDSAPD